MAKMAGEGLSTAGCKARSQPPRDMHAPSSPSAPLPSLCSAAHSPAEVQHRAALASRLQGESGCWQGWRRGEAGVGCRCTHSSQMSWQIHRALYPSGQCSASRGPAGVGERIVRVWRGLKRLGGGFCHRQKLKRGLSQCLCVSRNTPGWQPPPG